MRSRSETELSKIYSKSVLKEHVMGSFDNDSRNSDEEKQYKLAIKAMMLQDMYILWNEIQNQNIPHKEMVLNKITDLAEIVEKGQELPFEANSREEFQINLIQYLTQ
jgi:hypothetical protein